MTLARLFFVVSTLGVAVPALAGQADKQLDIYWIDSEGGGLTLIVTPAGESVLIDAGNPGERDVGRIHKTITQTAGLKKIDHLVVTHHHVDHFGGVPELADRIPIGVLYENGFDSAPPKEKNDPRMDAYRKLTKVGKRVIIQPGDVLPLAQTPGTAPLRIEVVGARQTFVSPKGARPNKALCKADKPKDATVADVSDNTNSVVMLVQLGGFRFFNGGDLTYNVEGQLVCPVDRIGEVDVYQTNHHGLDRSNNPTLVKTLNPTVAVFNNGPHKGCQPESFATVKALPKLKGLYQVHRNVRVGPEGNTKDEFIANKDEACTANFIKLGVEPGGKNYVVSIPSSAHQRKFATKRKK